MYPVHGKTPGAGGAGGGYCANTTYNPLIVDKCIFAAVTNAFKNTFESLFGGTGIGLHVPGLSTVPCVNTMFAIAPGAGINGGIGAIVPPAQYDIIAGPIISNSVVAFDMKQVLSASQTITGGASTTAVNIHISGVEIA